MSVCSSCARQAHGGFGLLHFGARERAKRWGCAWVQAV
jgi:hypothetical protein